MLLTQLIKPNHPVTFEKVQHSNIKSEEMWYIFRKLKLPHRCNGKQLGLTSQYTINFDSFLKKWSLKGGVWKPKQHVMGFIRPNMTTSPRE